MAPPAPLVPLPTATTIAPPRPAVVAPEPIIIDPLLPVFAEPELNTRRPLPPAAPPFAEATRILPELDAVPSPLSTLSAPPVTTVDRPD